MRFFKVVFASAIGYILAVVFLFGIVFVIGAAIASASKPDTSLPSNAVLNMKLNYPIKDKVNDNSPFAALAAIDPNTQVPVGLNEILQMLEEAKDNENIKGIILDLTALQVGYAKLSEVRNKIEEFKESGKFVYAYSEYYYYPTYYLASVADSVFIHPEGQMAFTGMVAQVAFFSDALKKMGLEMQVVRAGKFKGAVEPYTRTSLSDENRQQIQAYVNSIYNVTLSKIASNRGVSEDQMREDANNLNKQNIPYFLANNYIDMALHRDEFYSLMKKRMGVKDSKKVPLISEQKYARQLKSVGSGSDRIAVVYADGQIIGGKGDGTQIAAEDLASTLKKVRENDRIKAVVFRINSPGGSALASDIIWREAKLLSEAKPLIVSMGDVAASGGYYIAAPAQKIVAEPTTITGSIGVFGLVPNAQELLNEKLGVRLEYVGTGEHSDVGRIDRKMSEQERLYIERMIDKIYDTFLSRVSEGRKLSKDEVHTIAQGRVWTGVMAKEQGLVDELGGLEDAIEIAANTAELKEYKIREYPKSQDPVTELLKKLSGELSMEHQLKKAVEQSSFAQYAAYIAQFEEWGSKHTVQALMPYSVEVKNFRLH